MDISIILPCLNEEETVGICVTKARAVFDALGLEGEVIVVDNGSSDRSPEIAETAGASVIREPRRGYGQALATGFEAASGEVLVMADADDTYDLVELPLFLAEIGRGADFVIGNRRAGLQRGSMPWLHRLFGNPFLSWLVRRFSGTKCGDAYCGYRAFRREFYEKLAPREDGMEFALALLVRAARSGVRMAEVPISYSLRKGESKLRTFRDGWRSLRFLLLVTPKALFILPGVLLTLISLALFIPLTFGPVQFGSLALVIHPIFLAALGIIVGTELVHMGVQMKLFAIGEGIDIAGPFTQKFIRWFRLERLLAVGGLLAFVGVVIGFSIWRAWAQAGYGALEAVRPMVTATTLIAIGILTSFHAFSYTLLIRRQ